MRLVFGPIHRSLDGTRELRPTAGEWHAYRHDADGWTDLGAVSTHAEIKIAFGGAR